MRRISCKSVIFVRTLRISNSKLELPRRERSRHSKRIKTLMERSFRLMWLTAKEMRCQFRFLVRKFRSSITTSRQNRFTSSKRDKSRWTLINNSKRCLDSNNRKKLLYYGSLILNSLFFVFIFTSNKGEYVMSAGKDTIIVVGCEDNQIPLFAMKHQFI